MTLTREIRDRRMAVAEDAAAQIRARQFQVVCGSYLQVRSYGDYDPAAVASRAYLADLLGDPGADLKIYVDSVAPHCQGCARASLLLSKVRLYNDVKVGDVFTESGRPYVENAEMDALVADTFDAETMALIEAAFERSDSYDFSHVSDCYDREMAADLYRHIEDAEGRMLAILGNLTANDGAFVLYPESPAHA